MKIKVNNEIGRLKAVLLHRPGKELENLTPDTLEELLFDDIPYLKIAQKEHDEFAKMLKDKGIRVYYITDFLTETIECNAVAKTEFIETFAAEAINSNANIKDKNKAISILVSYLDQKENVGSMIRETIAGIKIEDVECDSLVDKSNTSFITMPLPNMYFQRDPFASIGNGVAINKMKSVTRNRETLYSDIIFKYHPSFNRFNMPFWYERDYATSIEGGDIIVLNDQTVIIGISERTSEASVEVIAHNLIKSDNNFKNVVAINIGNSRKYMHLDTIFTQVDTNAFIAHPEIFNKHLKVIEYHKDGSNIKVRHSSQLIDRLLAKHLKRNDIKLIMCGGDDPIASAREQWSDGANTLCIAPGEVIVYERNAVTNKLLNEAGIKTHVLSAAELSRGRGGPRCMSMPLVRSDV